MYHRGATQSHRQARPRVIFLIDWVYLCQANPHQNQFGHLKDKILLLNRVKASVLRVLPMAVPLYQVRVVRRGVLLPVILFMRRRLLLLLDSCYLRGRFVRGEIGHKLTLHIPYPLPSYSSLASFLVVLAATIHLLLEFQSAQNRYQF